MKIKLDENLPVRLASLLSELEHDVHTTQEEGLTGSPGPQIWAAAQRDSGFLSRKTWISPILEFMCLVPTAAFCWCVSIHQAASA
ncbi:MAG TPA: DUF5615 family PIN-like protein [Candidatus Angelobacter sp.]|nr:DUF5615 family PIN-like protein [Candidatus Angelobacter sp.]